MNGRNKTRLTEADVARILGLAVCEVSILVANNLLKPLKTTAHNRQKYFLAVDLEQWHHDETLWAKARDAIAEFWRE